MERPEITRKRMRELDGRSFLFEFKGDELFVHGYLYPVTGKQHRCAGHHRPNGAGERCRLVGNGL